MAQSLGTEHSENDYERFIRKGHIEPLTLFGFFPALIVSAIWLALARTNNTPHKLDLLLTCVSGVCLAFNSVYGCVGIISGWRYRGNVLRGTRPLPTTAGVVLIGLIIISVFHEFIYRGISLTSGVHASLYGAFIFSELCFFGPVSEELALQGFVQTRLRRFGVVTSLFATTIVFVCMHLTELPAAPSIADVGHIFVVFFPTLFVFALVRQMTGSLLAAIILHALYNAMTVFVFPR